MSKVNKSKRKYLGVTKKLMLAQTEEQKNAQSIQIEQVLRNEAKDSITYLTGKYGQMLEDRLGLDYQDIVNDMREQIWKAILTFDNAKEANFKTYVKVLISNRFKVLLHSGARPRHNFIRPSFDGDLTHTDAATPETIFTAEYENIYG